MCLPIRKPKIITVRGQKISDSLLETEHKYYCLVDSEWYDWCDGFWMMRLEEGEDTLTPKYRIIKGIRI